MIGRNHPPRRRVRIIMWVALLIAGLARGKPGEKEETT